MMKRQTDYSKEIRCLEAAFVALIEDIKAMYPNLVKGLERDKCRVLSLIKARGISIFTLDLPRLDEPFLNGLRDGQYILTGIPLARKAAGKGRLPRLFGGLYLLVFTEQGVLREAPDDNAIMSLRQLFNFGKKLKIECKESKVYETINTFYQTDLSLPDYTVTPLWENQYDPGVHRSCTDFVGLLPNNLGDNGQSDCVTERSDSQLLGVIQRVADLISTSLGIYNPYEYQCKHGPGAISEQPGVVDKYNITSWPEQLERVFPSCDFAFVNHSDWADRHSSLQQATDLRSMSSRLIQVPKTQNGPRLIAAEPLAFQFCQQNILAYLEDRIDHSWIGSFITLRDQGPNQRMAREGSITGLLATVDLSEASDRVSCFAIERIFRRNKRLLEALASCRSQYVFNQLDKKHPEIYRLKKFSTMGSACTFPIESLVFLSVVLGCILCMEGRPVTASEVLKFNGLVRVYGDDIILPSRYMGILRKALALMFFKVNNRKTFGTGKFRESCGVDAHGGYNVTPVRIIAIPSGDRPESIVSTVDTSNNLHKAGWWRCARVLRTIIDKIQSGISIVGLRSGAFGYESFTGPLHEIVRWSDKFSCWMYRSLRFKTKRRRVQREGIANLFQFFIEDPCKTWLHQWNSGYDLRPKNTLCFGWGPVYRSL